VRRIFNQHDAGVQTVTDAQCAQRKVAPHIAVHHQKRIAPQQRQCARHAAAGAKRAAGLVRITNAQTVTRAAAERLFNLPAKVRAVHHHAFDAGARQRQKLMLN